MKKTSARRQWWLLRALRIVVKTLAAVVFSFIVIIAVVTGLFFHAPELRFGEAEIAEFVSRFAPKSLALRFKEIDLRLVRPEGNWLAKEIRLQGEDLCVRYGDEALEFCFGALRLAATVGWGGDRLSHEPWYRPRIISIAPILLLGGHGFVEPAKFPKREPKPEKTNGFDVADFLRKHVLPKWRMAGSRIELLPLEVLGAEGSKATARFTLSTLQQGRLVRAELERLERNAPGARPLWASARLDLRRGEGWLVGGGSDQVREPWQALLRGRVKMGPARSIGVRANAEIHSWNRAEFKVDTDWRGVSALRDLGLRGSLVGSKIDALVSLKMGSMHAQVRALDVVDCAIDADLDEKKGGVRCGPQTVRLALYQRSGFKNPKLFTLAPEFDLRVSSLDFGDLKRADLELDFKLDQLGILRAGADVGGRISWLKGLTYDIEGAVNFSVVRLKKLAATLSETPFSIPAPLNTLDGPLDFTASVRADERSGEVRYNGVTRFDSNEQAVHLRLGGETLWTKAGKIVKPSTQAILYVDRLHITAPRFDLRQPPRFAPDRRFARITPEMIEEMSRDPGESVSGTTGAPVSGELGAEVTRARDRSRGVAVASSASEKTPHDFRLRIKTTKPNAIQVATNLTRGPIPVDLDVVYEDRARPMKVSGRPRPKVSGTVTVGKTSLEIFRRSATLEQLLVELRKSGDQVLNGQIAVSYLEYDIQIQLLGTTSEPEIRLSSTPPLERDQIISVLIFGRPLGDLDDDEKRSVSNLNAAFAEAALGISSLYLLASTPIESIGYDPDRELVTANVGLGGGTSLELGAGGDASSVGIRKRLSSEFIFRSEVERLGSTGKRTVSALIEWVKRF